MVRRLLKTRLRKASLVGGLSLSVGALALMMTAQPVHSSSDGSRSFLTGTWMVTLTPPQGENRVAPCTFTADVVGAQPQGSFTCIGNQRDAGGNGLLNPAFQGNWVLKDRGVFALTAVRPVYRKDTQTTLAARQVAIGEVSFSPSEDGDRILTGTLAILAQGPKGERTLQTVPGIELRGERVRIQSPPQSE